MSVLVALASLYSDTCGLGVDPDQRCADLSSAIASVLSGSQLSDPLHL
jgi:hypothetical protein